MGADSRLTLIGWRVSAYRRPYFFCYQNCFFKILQVYILKTVLKKGKSYNPSIIFSHSFWCSKVTQFVFNLIWKSILGNILFSSVLTSVFMFKSGINYPDLCTTICSYHLTVANSFFVLQFANSCTIYSSTRLSFPVTIVTTIIC